MKRLALYVTLFGTPIAPAGAEQVAGVIQGRCLGLTVASQSTGCSRASTVVYADLGNGRTMISVPADDGRVVAFAAEKDAQPTPGSYFMYLATVDAHTHATHAVADVRGTCHVNMSSDGMVWYDVVCQAQDSGSKLYSFRYDALGQRVKLLHRN